jgi:hypothetical protein
MIYKVLLHPSSYLISEKRWNINESRYHYAHLREEDMEVTPGCCCLSFKNYNGLLLALGTEPS